MDEALALMLAGNNVTIESIAAAVQHLSEVQHLA